MKAISILLIVSSAVFGGGCASTSVTPATTEPTQTLQRGHSIMVVPSEDGQFGGKVYEGTGTYVARNIESALEPYAKEVIRLPKVVFMDSAIAAASAKNCLYVVIPKITHWEDRATLWSGKADQIAIRMRVVDVTTHTELVNVEIKGKSSYFTFGSDGPELLLREPIAEFVSTLF